LQHAWQRIERPAVIADIGARQQPNIRATR
jgi:hypothetical protein